MATIYIRPEEVSKRLQQLDLDEKDLLRAVESGVFAWLECTENDPPSFAGIAAWAGIVRSLREQLLARGWDRLNDRNLPLTLQRSIEIAITASSGDEFTGLEAYEPRTRNPKGSTTQQKVKDNATQLGLFEDMTTPPQNLVEEISKWGTWLLLSYRDLNKRVVRCELSRPIKIGVDGRVDGWYERIILGEIAFDGNDVLMTRGGGDGDGITNVDSGSNAIEVEVRRRA